MLASTPETLSRAFVRLGWISFWLQILLATFPVLLTIYVLVIAKSAENQWLALGVIDTLSILGLFILLFTIFWSYRYTRVGKRIVDPQRRPPREKVMQTLWLGVAASGVAIVFSILLTLIEVSRLMFVFLQAPQGGLPVIQTATYDPSTWVSAIDMVGLLADMFILTAELVVIGFTLWLLFRTTTVTNYDE